RGGSVAVTKPIRQQGRASRSPAPAESPSWPHALPDRIARVCCLRRAVPSDPGERRAGRGDDEPVVDLRLLEADHLRAAPAPPHPGRAPHSPRAARPPPCTPPPAPPSACPRRSASGTPSIAEVARILDRPTKAYGPTRARPRVKPGSSATDSDRPVAGSTSAR